MMPLESWEVGFMTSTEKVMRELKEMLSRWNNMSAADQDDAESAADTFESSFYAFMDAVREWTDGLDPRPASVEDLLELPLITEIVAQLPAPLLLNFETEAELIIERQFRIDEDKYD